jgi:hypothetical protein
MDTFEKFGTIGVMVCAFIAVFVWTLLKGRCWKWFKDRATGKLGGLTDKPMNIETYKELVRSRWTTHHTKLETHSKKSFRFMGQIDGQLVAPCDFQGNPLSPEGEQQIHSVSLVGNLVRVYSQDTPCVSMYIHPQDTIMEIMQKFQICADQVFVYRGAQLQNVNKTLLECGVPDNWTIGLVVEPRMEPPALEESDEETLDKIFQTL